MHFNSYSKTKKKEQFLDLIQAETADSPVVQTSTPSNGMPNEPVSPAEPGLGPSEPNFCENIQQPTQFVYEQQLPASMEFDSPQNQPELPH